MTTPTIEARVQDALAPCPFCGEVPPPGCFIMDTAQGNKWGYVQCGCGVKGPEVRTEYNPSPDAPWHSRAAKEWNRRNPAFRSLAASATQVPQGWKLVPVEPTEEMLVHGQEAWLAMWRSKPSIEDCKEAENTYKAMLSASPPAPQAATQGEVVAEAEFDRELADTAMRFVDRAGDTCETDTAERICAEFHKAMSAVVFKYRPPHSAVINEPAPAPSKEQTNG